MMLQRAIGNSTTLNLLQTHRPPSNTRTIQRMPTRDEMLAQAGSPKVGKHSEGSRKIYLEILFQLDSLDMHKQKPLADTLEAIQSQFMEIKKFHDTIEEKASQYIQKNSKGIFGGLGKKIKYLTRLIEQSQQEKAALVPVMLKLSNNIQLLLEPPSIQEAIDEQLNQTVANRFMREGAIKETEGGMNPVRFYEEGVFKAPQWNVSDEMLATSDPNWDDPEWKALSTGQGNQWELGGKILGLQQQDSLVNREIAMSYLDQLLGAGVLVHTERALESDGENINEGVIMENANGESMGTISSQEGHRVIDRNPAIRRDLSKIQLLDVLARQIDRHSGNYVILKDENGNITGVKGFDHDMSFARNADMNKAWELPGIAKYVDKELAERIIALNPQMLAWVLEGLLQPDIIEMTLERLAILKDHLIEHQDKLLEPGEWEEAIASGAVFTDEKAYLNVATHWRDKDVRGELKKERNLF